MNFLANILLGIVQGIVNQVRNAIGSVLTIIVDGFNRSIITPISNDIGNALGALGNGVTAMEQNVSNAITGTIKSVTGSLSAVVGSVEAGFSSVLGNVEAGLSEVANGSVNVFKQIVSGVENGFNALTGAVGKALEDVAVGFHDAVNELGNTIAEKFTAVFKPVAAFVEALPHDIVSVGEQVLDVLKENAKEAQLSRVALETANARLETETILKGIQKVDTNRFKDVFTPVSAALVSAVSAATGIKISGELVTALNRMTDIAGAEAIAGALEAPLPGLSFIIGRLISHIADTIAIGDFRILQQAGNAGSQNELLELGEVIRGKYRGNISDDVFFDQFARSGYSEEKAAVMFKNAEQLLAINDLVALRFRGRISSDDELFKRAGQIQVSPFIASDLMELYRQLLGAGDSIELWRRDILPQGFKTHFDDLERAGFTPDRIEALKSISYRLPSVFEYQDFIARRVDDPEQVKKFQLDFGIDDNYFKIAKANGYDEKTARQIYHSYWNLPPFFLLASEFKAGKINEETMREALAFQRFTPFWIEAFVSQLKPTLTQGDIKDMYKYQTIGADDIVPELVKIGTTKELAEQLKTLWIASVKLASPLDQTAAQTASVKLKDDTTSLIKTAYKDGLLDRDQAKAKLIEVHESESAADLILSITDYETKQTDIKDTAARLKDDILSGAISLNDATTEYAQAGANDRQMLQFVDSVNKASRSKPKTPTLAEFQGWYKKGIISAGELASALSLLGYSEVWIPFFLLDAKIPPDDIAALGFTFQMPSV